MLYQLDVSAQDLEGASNQKSVLEFMHSSSRTIHWQNIGSDLGHILK